MHATMTWCISNTTIIKTITTQRVTQLKYIVLYISQAPRFSETSNIIVYSVVDTFILFKKLFPINYQVLIHN